jgi:hypothetical protein
MQQGRASQLLPVTERVLRRLPGPRLVWILVWASLSMLVDLVLPILAGAPGSRADIAAAAVAVYGNLIAL